MKTTKHPHPTTGSKAPLSGPHARLAAEQTRRGTYVKPDQWPTREEIRDAVHNYARPHDCTPGDAAAALGFPVDPAGRFDAEAASAWCRRRHPMPRVRVPQHPRRLGGDPTAMLPATKRLYFEDGRELPADLQNRGMHDRVVDLAARPAPPPAPTPAAPKPPEPPAPSPIQRAEALADREGIPLLAAMRRLAPRLTPAERDELTRGTRRPLPPPADVGAAVAARAKRCGCSKLDGMRQLAAENPNWREALLNNT